MGNVTYDIDGAGRRVGRTIDDGVTVQVRRYLLADGNRVVAEYDGSGTLISQFFYATRRHVPDFMIQGTNIYRFITDQLGSVRLVVKVNEATPTIVQQIEYDVWGNVTNTPATFDQPFGFAGGLWDRETGLVHFGAREYDPEVGRWLQRDPILFGGGDTNLYAYAGGDPVNAIDPNGLDIWIEGSSGKEPSAHMSIAIGDPLGSYWSHSFRYTGGVGTGQAYLDVTPGGPILQYMKTSPGEDKIAERLLRDFENADNNRYYASDWTCRGYSEYYFDFFSDTFGRSASPPPPRAVTPLAPRSTGDAVADAILSFLARFVN